MAQENTEWEAFNVVKMPGDWKIVAGGLKCGERVGLTLVSTKESYVSGKKQTVVIKVRGANKARYNWAFRDPENIWIVDAVTIEDSRSQLEIDQDCIVILNYKNPTASRLFLNRLLEDFIRDRVEIFQEQCTGL